MAPFLMSLVSDGDHWMFVLSNGGLTAGRINPDHALFPYYTQDKLLDMAAATGSRTLILLESRGGDILWEPFAANGHRDGAVRRGVRKNDLGNHIVLQERQDALGLCLRTSWRPSGAYGFVRRVELENMGETPVSVRVLDGLQNLLPPGLTQRFQNEFSILGDAYKQAELALSACMGIYHLSSVPTDLAEPMEALRASVAWQTGLKPSACLLSDRQIDAFAAGREIETESSCRGTRGAYLTEASHSIEPGGKAVWYICADLDKDAAGVESLQAEIRDGENLAAAIEADCRRTEEGLRKMVASADGLQMTGQRQQTMRHTSNTVFNLMRGGALVTGYELPTSDLLATVEHFNKEAAVELQALMNPSKPLTCRDPWDRAHPLSRCGKNLLRLVREYLPLSFSRRHGDPSRPWNRFSIEIREADGSPRFYYQGNWRDIFQNWEALLHSYPEYLEASICRFLNASSADGYNPYRLTKDGYEWEVIEPGDAWANIGYWGDHQIIYLLRLLEASHNFHPGRLQRLLGEETCVYAEIPYRIRPFEAILENPRDTIDYDEEWANRIEARVEKIGGDGKLMPGPEGGILTVCMMEKLLAPLLAKLANFIPDGGIWMNTQRPEWNDANNALVGYGISVVTTSYVARYLDFLLKRLEEGDPEASYTVSVELVELLEQQDAVFKEEARPLSAAERLDFMERLGNPASAFRKQVYEKGLSGRKVALTAQRIRTYLQNALEHTSVCLRANKRPDALWHSYNLLHLDQKEANLERLFVMLEGQVSILSAGILKPEECLELLRALRQSKLYREDQDSYILYPDRSLPAFLDKNQVPEERIAAIPLLARLSDAGDQRIIRPRPKGGYAFNGNFHNRSDLEAALDAVERGNDCGPVTEADRRAVLDLFEEVFNHHAFTGRSGTFFAYEGLGSIYWHMVSKLVLAVQENIDPDAAGGSGIMSELRERYHSLREGLGVNKNPAHYGAIPTDAYSHTPAHAGAQQPGMTGQVKEDILIRLAELGLRVEDGQIVFRTDLLSRKEFLETETRFPYLSIDGNVAELPLPGGSLAYTFCQVPVVYTTGRPEPAARVVYNDGQRTAFPDLRLPHAVSREIFGRTGKISRIEVELA